MKKENATENFVIGQGDCRGKYSPEIESFFNAMNKELADVIRAKGVVWTISAIREKLAREYIEERELNGEID